MNLAPAPKKLRHVGQNTGDRSKRVPLLCEQCLFACTFKDGSTAHRAVARSGSITAQCA